MSRGGFLAPRRARAAGRSTTASRSTGRRTGFGEDAAAAVGTRGRRLPAAHRDVVAVCRVADVEGARVVAGEEDRQGEGELCRQNGGQLRGAGADEQTRRTVVVDRRESEDGRVLEQHQVELVVDGFA